MNETNKLPEKPKFPDIEYREEPSIIGGSALGIVLLLLLWFIFILVI